MSTNAPAFGDYPNELYFAGLVGVPSNLPTTYERLEAEPREALDESVCTYTSGVGDEQTQQANVEAFLIWSAHQHLASIGRGSRMRPGKRSR